MMLGSEGRLGHWDMPLAEPDMDQKTTNNLTTLENSVLLLTAYDVLHAKNTDSRISFTKADNKVIAKKQARQVWLGMGGGALSELSEAGLGEKAADLVKEVKEHVLFGEEK